jgi:hypothetical protein
MVYLLDTVGNEMRTRRSGRILITGSIEPGWHDKCS